MTDVFENEYDVLDGSNMVSTVNLRYRSYFTINWNGQKNENVHLFVKHYPHWDYDVCDKKGYSAKDFKKFAQSMGKIDDMATGVSVC